MEKMITSEDKKRLATMLCDKNVELKAFFLGFADDVDKAIIQYIAKGNNHGVVTLDRLKLHFIYENVIVNRRRLYKRLEILERDGLIKRETLNDEYNGITIVKLIK